MKKKSTSRRIAKKVLGRAKSELIKGAKKKAIKIAKKHGKKVALGAATAYNPALGGALIAADQANKMLKGPGYKR